jgi:hypothetical protein
VSSSHRYAHSPLELARGTVGLPARLKTNNPSPAVLREREINWSKRWANKLATQPVPVLRSLRSKPVGLRDQERDEERADGQRGHHEYSQHDVAIWKTPAQRLEEASRNRLPFLFRKHCYPPILRDRQYRDSMNLSTIRHVVAALVNVGYRLPWQVDRNRQWMGRRKKALVLDESRLAAGMAKAYVLQRVLTCRLGSESARFRYQERDEERAEGQRGHHEYVGLYRDLPFKKEEYADAEPGQTGKSKSSKYRNEMHVIHFIAPLHRRRADSKRIDGDHKLCGDRQGRRLLRLRRFESIPPRAFAWMHCPVSDEITDSPV